MWRRRGNWRPCLNRCSRDSIRRSYGVLDQGNRLRKFCSVEPYRPVTGTTELVDQILESEVTALFFPASIRDMKASTTLSTSDVQASKTSLPFLV
ncbi:hypothetical protein D5086_008775 [Populus alba]|uniref:Uncharacterized protein n=1 Tax=Populus alba TaxID=43335 RepID=A0ACC4CIV2_POPAL